MQPDGAVELLRFYWSSGTRRPRHSPIEPHAWRDRARVCRMRLSCHRLYQANSVCARRTLDAAPVAACWGITLLYPGVGSVSGNGGDRFRNTLVQELAIPPSRRYGCRFLGSRGACPPGGHRLQFWGGVPWTKARIRRRMAGARDAARVGKVLLASSRPDLLSERK